MIRRRGPPGGGRGTEPRLSPEVQILTLLHTIFDRKGTPLVYLPAEKIVPLSYAYGATSTKLFT